MVHRKMSPAHPGTFAAVAFAAALVGCAQTSTGGGEFVVLLGTDTTSVERYTRTADGFHVTAVVRAPRTTIRTLEVTFGPGGEVEHAVATRRDPSAGDDSPPLRRLELAFAGDSATMSVEGADGERQSRAFAVESRMLPRWLNFYSLQQLLVERAEQSGRDTLFMLGDGPVPYAVRRPADDSIAFVTPDFGTWSARLDALGRIETLDAGLFGRTVTRVQDLDIDALAATWAAQDAAGEGMGPLSPRDTTRVTVGGATLTFDYGRPSKRGRQVFGDGGLEPYGEVWRAGANLATHLTTDRRLVVGDTPVPAGTYTIYAIPNPGEWTLIINRQTGQWGTEYDAGRDLARIPMPVTSPGSPVEMFTISVEPTGGGAGEIAFTWDRTRAAVAFRVAAAT